MQHKKETRPSRQARERVSKNNGKCINFLGFGQMTVRDLGWCMAISAAGVAFMFAFIWLAYFAHTGVFA